MTKLLASFLACCLLLACSRDSHSDYLGVWQTADKSPKTWEVLKDGDTYLLSRLSETDAIGKPIGPAVLTKLGEQLAFNNGLSAVPMGLSGDKKSLYFDKWTFVRVPAGEAQKVKDGITKQREARIANRERCAALRKEFDQKQSGIDASKQEGQAKLSQKNALRQQLASQAEEIPDCKRQLMLF